MLLLAVLAAVPLFPQGKTSLRHVDPDDRFAARTCAVCHEATYEQWRVSRHAHAATNAIYTVSAAHFSRPWCTNCHAPMESASEGVSCAACHVRDGEILTAAPPTDAARRAHAARHEPSLGDARFCAGCHEFPMPDRRSLESGEIVYTSRLLQKTYTEWLVADADRTCQSCHMKSGAHLFPGAHDDALVRNAVTLDVWRERGAVMAELRAEKVAHHVPTGDPFRRLVLSLCDDETCTQIKGSIVFARTFDGEQLREDTSIAKTRRVRREIDAAFYRLDYFFGDAKLQAALAPQDVSFELARGRVKGSP